MLQENLNPSDSPILQESSPKFGSGTQVADSQEGKSVIVRLSESGNIMKESFSGKVEQVKTALEKWRQPKSQILPRYMPTGSVRRKTPRRKIEHKKKWSSVSRVLFVLGSGCLVVAALVGVSYFVSDGEVYMTRELADTEDDVVVYGQVEIFKNVRVKILYDDGLDETYFKSTVTLNLNENTLQIEGKKTLQNEGKKTLQIEGKKTLQIEGKKTLQIEGKKAPKVLKIGDLNYDSNWFTGLTDEDDKPVYLQIRSGYGKEKLIAALEKIAAGTPESSEEDSDDS